MGEHNRGLKRLLSFPLVYDGFSRMLGVAAAHRELARRYIRARTDDRILDIGCGTAAITRYLQGVEYFGFDIHPGYIAVARKRLGRRCHVWCASVDTARHQSVPTCDIVLAVGVLHHLDDDEADKLFDLARHVLRPGGRLVTLDCCYTESQSRTARFVISNDRGRSVGDVSFYRSRAARAFTDIRTAVRTDLLRIPYTHLVMECVQTSSRRGRIGNLPARGPAVRTRSVCSDDSEREGESRRGVVSRRDSSMASLPRGDAPV